MPTQLNPDVILEVFAQNGDKVIPPQTDVNNYVNYDQGYTPDYELDLSQGNPSAKAVERRVMNYLLNSLTTNAKDFQIHGFPQWQSGMSGGYDQNSFVTRLDASVTPNIIRVWRSLVPNNSVDPASVGQTSWEYMQSVGQLLQNIPMPSGGPNGPTAELITASFDFNTFTSPGTFEVKTDTLAAGAAHGPLTSSGGSIPAGMLEVKSWSGAGLSTYVIQRYTDRLGNSYYRGGVNSTFGSWSTVQLPNNYSADTSTTANVVQGSQYMQSSTLVDNQQFYVKIANNNTGPTTFTPNPSVISTPLNVVGAGGLPLDGGELVAAGRALFIYKADTNTMLLQHCSSGAQQGVFAQSNHQFVTLQQAKGLSNFGLMYYMSGAH